MKKYGPKECILGVTVTSRAVHAVLIAEGPEGTEVVRRFQRQRNARVAPMPGAADPMAGGDSGAAAADDLQDFTIQFNDPGSTAPDLFLSSEFSDLQDAAPGEIASSDSATPTSFEMELTDILAECNDIGYPDPLVSFCIVNTEVTAVELKMPEAGGRRKAEKKAEKKDQDEAAHEAPRPKKAEDRPEKASADQGQLMGLLADQYEGSFDEERVVFVPMTPSEDGLARYLAIVPHANDPVTLTLNELRNRKATMPTARLLDAEMTLYMGVARIASSLVSGETAHPIGLDIPDRTLIVRAGLEDTLVMFMADGVLQHYESLRSITTYDAPETICSRVLLLQDEYGVGDVEHVLLLGDEREGALVESFQLFFPDTRVESLRRYLPDADKENTGELPARATVLALLVGLRLVKDETYKRVFEEVNLLPKRLLRRQFKMPVSWHVFAFYGLLFITVLFFVARFYTQKHELDLFRYRMQEFPEDITDIDPKALQARIDSLKQASQGYMHALNVLDSLLIGSDKWSRSMETTAEEVASVRGMWIERWQPRGTFIELIGNATTRDHVVSFAEKIGGTIETLTFSEIREWPVYSFRMRIPLANELPAAAKYLRDNVVVNTANGAPVTGTEQPERRQ